MRSWLAPLALVALSCCYSPPVENPQTRVTQETPIRFPASAQDKVDILFMVDNSLSMDAMQSELRARFGDFLSVFDALAARGTFADLHIGVVTSDFGAGDQAIVDGCDASPGGQRGLLQAIGKAAAPGCAGPVGHPYIEYAYADGGARHDLPAGQTLQQTFTCMASVGSRGCGFEHPLESVYAALGNAVENAGFLRDDALLAVVFVTNEDDGSAPPAAKIYENDPAYGAYDTYRQTRYGIACGSPLALPPYAPSNGPLAGCVPAPNVDGDRVGEEYDVQRYVDLLTRPHKLGGIKRNPNDVIVVGLDGPAGSVEIIAAKSTSGGGSGAEPAYVPCSPVDGKSCLVRVQHSCQNAVQPAFFADPAVRLHAVVSAAPNHVEASICGDDLMRAPDFSTVLVDVANRIKDNLLPGCIPAPLSSRDQPDCVVADVSVDDVGVERQALVPRCDLAPGTFPCWTVEVKPLCKDSSPESLGVTIERNGVAPPPDTYARVFCSTLAQ